MDRTDRISEEIKKEISVIIRNELKDPRLPEFVTVTAARVSKDLKHAKIYVSVLGDNNNKENALAALKSAAGYIRKEIGHRIRIRYSPELEFIFDDSIEHGIYISKLLDKTKNN